MGDKKRSLAWAEITSRTQVRCCVLLMIIHMALVPSVVSAFSITVDSDNMDIMWTIGPSLTFNTDDTISFSWVFSTDETPGDTEYDDEVGAFLGDTKIFNWFVSDSTTGVDGGLASILLDSSGTDVIFQIFADNVMDHSVSSRLTVDNIVITPDANSVPVPATMFLLGSGLVGLAGFKRKFKKYPIKQHQMDSCLGTHYPPA